MSQKTTPSGSISGKSVLVVGAGMVGVCVALDLIRRGAKVTLIDRRAPGLETSYGNAGVLARSSLMPLNNPGLFRNLSNLLGNRSTSFRYSLSYIARNYRWAASFLANARRARFAITAKALDDLISISTQTHKALISECGQEHLLSEDGWIFLYRTESCGPGNLLRLMLDRFDVAHDVLNNRALRDMEPHLAPIFPTALWVQDTASVRDPGALVAAYAKRFVAEGGIIKTGSVIEFWHCDQPVLTLEGGEKIQANHCVLCTGPWGKELLGRAGYKVPMAFERGYHRHFTGPYSLGNEVALSRPVYDTAGGYVLAPMNQGLRLTTGVELTDLEAVENYTQLDLAESAARQAIDLGTRCENSPTWMGARPTFPDSRPCIGVLPKATGVSVALGHQHIGFSTGPGTARLLGDLLEGKKPPIDPSPFKPERYIVRI